MNVMATITLHSKFDFRRSRKGELYQMSYTGTVRKKMSAGAGVSAHFQLACMNVDARKLN